MWYGACIEQILKEECIYNIFFLKKIITHVIYHFVPYLFFFSLLFLSLYQNKLFTFYVFNFFYVLLF
jgi:hypothetical protein